VKGNQSVNAWAPIAEEGDETSLGEGNGQVY
jgi:hypothetical protein